MPTVNGLEFSLSTGGSVFAPHAHRRTVQTRDQPPILREHNEAEWESTKAFLEGDQREADKLRRLAVQALDLTVLIPCACVRSARCGAAGRRS
jgi:hypothetical protein